MTAAARVPPENPLSTARGWGKNATDIVIIRQSERPADGCRSRHVSPPTEDPL